MNWFQNLTQGVRSGGMALPAPGQQQAPAPANGAQPAPVVPSGAPAGTPAGVPAAAPQGQPEQKSGLDGFGDLFKIPEGAQNKQDVFASPLFTTGTDSEAFQQGIGNIDFTQGVNSELYAKALGGDQASLQQLLNSVQRGTFARMARFTQQMVEHGLKTYHERSSAAMPDVMRNVMTQTQMQENPIMAHKNVQPLVDSLRTAFIAANPNATPAQIAQQVSNYLTTVAQEIGSAAPRNGVNGNPVNPGASSQQPASQNWEDLLFK